MQIRCLAIDDEPLALLQLQNMIELTPYLTLAAACKDAFEAIRMLNQVQVDAIFVDISMPDLNGLDFVRSLTHPPLIVFTTAYSQYAIDGFRLNAVDYLLKPFGMPEFLKSAEKLKRQYELEHPDPVSPSTPPVLNDDTIFIKVDYRTVRVSISQIAYIESKGEYLSIHLDSGETLTFLMTIKKLADLLPATDFIRIHRSYIVNMSKVVEVSKLRLKVGSADGTYLPISELYKDDVQRYVDCRTVGR